MRAHGRGGHTSGPCQPELHPPGSRLDRLSGDGDLNLNTGLNVDDDLLDGLGGGVEARKCASG